MMVTMNAAALGRIVDDDEPEQRYRGGGYRWTVYDGVAFGSGAEGVTTWRRRSVG